MKNKNQSLLFLLFFFLVETLDAQLIYVLDETQTIGFIDVKNDCKFTPLCSANNISALVDISFHPDGNLYLLNSSGTLFTVDTLDCSMQKVGDFPNSSTDFYVALTADAEGILFAAGSRVAKFEPANGQFSDLGALPIWGWGGGDLTFRDGQLFLATQSNALLKIKVSKPAQSSVVFNFDVPTSSNVYGIVTFADGCNSQATFATVSEPGNRHFLYEVDFKNKSISKKCETPLLILGAATKQEFLVSECDTTDANPPNLPTGAVFLPNTFSPDDDGKNDFFTPFADLAAEPTVELLRIYDRWGGLVFEKKDFKPNNEPDGWNGSLANTGKKVPNGVYVFYCQIGFSNGARLVKSGNLTVARSDF